MRCSHPRIDLLKLLVLLGISAGVLPTRIKGLNIWFTNYIVADASDDAEPHQNGRTQQDDTTRNSTNVTSLVNGTLAEPPAYNFNDSIVRVGAQTPGASEPPLQVGESNQTTRGSNQQEQAIDQLTSRQDSAPPLAGSTGPNNNPSATSASYGGASNHKNYPIEPYPSASYTSLAVHAPSATTTSNVSPLATASSSATAAAQASTLNSLLNRDYHHSFNLSEHNGNSNLLSPNHRTNVPSSQIAQQQQQQQQVVKSGQLGSPHADAQTAYAQILNHNFENTNNYPGDLTAGGSSLNTGLIQNLTAGLFPVTKLSNATLSSLSELLSKTKLQQQQSQTFQAGNFGAGSANHLFGQTTTGSATNGYRPASAAQSYQLPLQAASQQANNYLEALLGDHRFTSSMFDYLNQPSAAQPPSQFGFREPSSVARLQSPASLYNRPVTQPQQSTGATVNIQKHKLDGAAHHQREGGGGGKQPATNGQMLNMAATLYDNYLDQNYRANQQYQFVQSHQASNQNHLDKVVYHSTPFRPSIASPPSSSQTLAATTAPSSAMIGGNHQRPRTEADVKSVSHAALNGPDHVMAGQSNVQQQQNFGKLGAYQPGRQVALGATKFDDALESPFSGARANSSRFVPQTSGGQQNLLQQQQQQMSAANGKHQSASAGTPQRPVSASASAQATGALVGPQLLLDLYERAIDSQIQEAIYSDHQQHFQHLGPLASAAASSSPAGSATAATNSNAWPAGASYDDTPYESTTGYTAPALAASGSPGRPTSATTAAAMAALMSQQQSQQSLDPLASALSELPAFSASDLQPLIPGGATSEPVYSLLPPSGDHSPAPPATIGGGGQSDASSLAALIAQFSTATPHSAHLSPVHNQQPMTSSASSLHQLLLGDYEQFGAYGPGPVASSAFPMASTVAPQAVAFAQPSQTQQAGGSASSSTGGSSAGSLPSIFTKFTQSGQLSSILASPFAHLYANLPRYRYTKQQQHSKHAARDQTTAASQSATTVLSKQQAAAALAASAAANLIAGSGHSLTPLQAAMLQAQLATSAYLQADPGAGLAAAAEQPPTASSTGIGSYSTPADFSTSPGGQPLGGLLSLASGLAGGGVSPAVWRNFLSPMMGARKQQTQSGANHVNGSQKHTTPTGGNLYQHQQRPSAQSLALVNSLWGAGGGGGGGGSLSQLLAPAASSPGIYESLPTRAHAQKKPRLKIKILKIPVAFYDAAAGSSATAGSHAETGSGADGLGSSISLMPAHLQPSPTASLLASLAACPYHAQHQLTTGGGPFAAYPSHGSTSASNLFGLPATMGQPPGYTTPASAAEFSSPWSQSSSFSPGQTQQVHPGGHNKHSQQVGGSAAPSSSHPATAATTTTGAGPGEHSGKPTPIRDFTDINQPNDLQVSPTSNANFSPTLTQQPHQQHHSLHQLRKSRARK